MFTFYLYSEYSINCGYWGRELGFHIQWIILGYCCWRLDGELANPDAAECLKLVGKGQSNWRKLCKLPAKTLQALGFHLSRPKMGINLSSLVFDGVKTRVFKYSLLGLPG
jgi:hypothetical protein